MSSGRSGPAPAHDGKLPRPWGRGAAAGQQAGPRVSPLGAQLHSLLTGTVHAGGAAPAGSCWLPGGWSAAEREPARLPPVAPLDLRSAGSLLAPSAGSRASTLTDETLETLLGAGSLGAATAPSVNLGSLGGPPEAGGPPDDDAADLADAQPPAPPEADAAGSWAQLQAGSASAECALQIRLSAAGQQQQQPPPCGAQPAAAAPQLYAQLEAMQSSCRSLPAAELLGRDYGKAYCCTHCYNPCCVERAARLLAPLW